MNDTGRAMIYGATGYTGRLIARRAVERGLRPIIAGRDHDAVTKFAGELDCPCASFSLETPAQVATQIQGLTTVLNCAGPFSKTARTLIDACLAVGANYLDITGEIDVIELAAARGPAARERNVALMPAVGFDVVPSDCLAAMLAARVPKASVLQLAFTADGTVSPGTAKTVLETMPRGGRARIDGEIRHVPIAWKSTEIPFRAGKVTCTTVPWGDVASAYYSTGIPNIEVYSASPARQIKWLRRLRFLMPMLSWQPLQSLGRRWISKRIPGPKPEEVDKLRSSFWGRVSDDHGNAATATLETLGGYRLTALTAVAVLERSLTGKLPYGFATASQAFGKEFILEFPDTDVRWE